MVGGGEISSRVAKDILAHIVKNPVSPKAYATENDLIQKNDEGALKEIAQKIIDANPADVACRASDERNKRKCKPSAGSENTKRIDRVGF